MLSIRPNRPPVAAFLCSVAFLLLVRPMAVATTISTTPYPTRALPGLDCFLARDSDKSVALYRRGDLSRVRRFAVRSDMRSWGVPIDEKVLIIASYDDSLAAFDVATGEVLWSRSGDYVDYGFGFSQDGRFFLVNGACVYETRTGRLAGQLLSPPRRTTVKVAALCPDGSGGILINSDGELYTFDVATGRLTYTGVKGFRYVVQATYAADGKHILLCDYRGDGEYSMLTVGAGWKVRGPKPVLDVGLIKPTADGSFLLTTLDTKRDGNGIAVATAAVGLRWHPGASLLETLWRIPDRPMEPEPMDFFPDKLIGVRTDFRFLTQVVDLKTGAVIGVVDNRANYRVHIASSTESGVLDWLLRRLRSISDANPPLTGGAAVALAAAVAMWLLFRRSSRNRISGTAADVSVSAGSPPTS